MNRIFNTNKKLNRVKNFALVNGAISFVLLFILSFEVQNLGNWVRIIYLLFFAIIVVILFLESLLISNKIEVGPSYFIFYFLLKKSHKLPFESLEMYATACYGNGRLAFYHAIVFQFSGKPKFLVSELQIEDYTELLNFMQESNFTYFGYIGQNNWKKRAWSKKWVTKTEEKWMLGKLGKNKGLFSFYFANLFLCVINVSMLYVLIIQN